jgi:protein SCO1
MKTIPALLLVPLFLAPSIATLSAGDFGSTNHQHSCCSPVESAAAFTEKSLYQLGSSWTTDTGKQVKLGSLRGRPQVVVMFFANCQYACPLLVHDLQQIEEALKPAQRARTGFTLVTFDPKRDTPESLGEYRRVHVLPAERWTLLRAEAEDVQELAALLGVRYKQDARGQFAHSNVITILNAQGEIVHQQVGLNQDIQENVRVLARLIDDSRSAAVQ